MGPALPPRAPEFGVFFLAADSQSTKIAKQKQQKRAEDGAASERAGMLLKRLGSPKPATKKNAKQKQQIICYIKEPFCSHLISRKSR